MNRNIIRHSFLFAGAGVLRARNPPQSPGPGFSRKVVFIGKIYMAAKFTGSQFTVYLKACEPVYDCFRYPQAIYSF
jgi:hypothetical protein